MQQSNILFYWKYIDSNQQAKNINKRSCKNNKKICSKIQNLKMARDEKSNNKQERINQQASNMRQILLFKT